MKKDRVGKISNAPDYFKPLDILAILEGRDRVIPIVRSKPYIPVSNQFVQKILVVNAEDVDKIRHLSGTYDFGASFLSPVINGKVLVLTYNPANYLYL